MGITITDETVHLTRISVHTPEFESPIDFYIRGSLSDEYIHNLEIFIENTRELDKSIGIYECILRFCKENNVQICYLH
jgi:hypothetical protein